MKRYFSGLAAALSVLLAVASAFAQAQLGGMSLYHFEPTPISSVRFTMGSSFFERIGGVAFMAVAVPAHDSDAAIATISYDATRPDGHRGVVTMRDGSVIDIPLHDWELLPLVRYADSGNSNCVTAFGDLADQRAATIVRNRHGFVVNYHPALKDTLLGLRLWEADMLIFEPDTADLPKRDDGSYILGAGEWTPRLASSQAGWNQLHATVTAASAANGEYRSYVLTDVGRRMTFDMSTGSVHVDGTPYYYFWRYNLHGDAADAAEEEEGKRILNATSGMSLDATRRWLTSQLKSALAEVDSMTHPRVSSWDDARTSSADLVELAQGLVAARMRAREVRSQPVHLAALDSAATPPLLEAANPEVYRAAVVTAQYAAFFRYVRREKSASWRAFTQSTRLIQASPAVDTPTAVVPPTASAGSSASPF